MEKKQNNTNSKCGCCGKPLEHPVNRKIKLVKTQEDKTYGCVNPYYVTHKE